jgi:hypothetical protein
MTDPDAEHRTAITDWGSNPLEAQLSEIRANKAIDVKGATTSESVAAPSWPTFICG